MEGLPWLASSSWLALDRGVWLEVTPRWQSRVEFVNPSQEQAGWLLLGLCRGRWPVVSQGPLGLLGSGVLLSPCTSDPVHSWGWWPQLKSPSVHLAGALASKQGLQLLADPRWLVSRGGDGGPSSS